MKLRDLLKDFRGEVIIDIEDKDSNDSIPFHPIFVTVYNNGNILIETHIKYWHEELKKKIPVLQKENFDKLLNCNIVEWGTSRISIDDPIRDLVNFDTPCIEVFLDMTSFLINPEDNVEGSTTSE